MAKAALDIESVVLPSSKANSKVWGKIFSQNLNLNAGRRRWRECTGSYSAAPDPLDVPTPGYTLGLISPAHSAHAHALHMLHMCAMPVRRFSFGKRSQQPLPEPLELSVSRVRPHGRSSGSPPARL